MVQSNETILTQTKTADHWYKSRLWFVHFWGVCPHYAGSNSWINNLRFHFFRHLHHFHLYWLNFQLQWEWRKIGQKIGSLLLNAAIPSFCLVSWDVFVPQQHLHDRIKAGNRIFPGCEGLIKVCLHCDQDCWEDVSLFHHLSFRLGPG